MDDHAVDHENLKLHPSKIYMYYGSSCVATVAYCTCNNNFTAYEINCTQLLYVALQHCPGAQPEFEDAGAQLKYIY